MPVRRLLIPLLLVALLGACDAGADEAGAGDVRVPSPSTAEPDPTPTPSSVPTPNSVPAPSERPAPSTPPGSSADVPTPRVEPSGPFGTAWITIERVDADPLPLHVHVADDPATRGRGLMGREDVPEGTGMLFLFPLDTDSGFWMRDTLVPLSIAFADADGTVLRILDMQPCPPSGDCPTHRPGVSYRFALEVPQGAFDAAGVAEGDRIVLPPALQPGG